MVLHNMYIYNRKGICVYYEEWNRPVNNMSDDPAEEKKLVYGMLFSMKDLVSKLSPAPGGEGLHTIKTNAFTMHHFQSATGMVFIINSDPDTADLYPALLHIYSNIYVDCVARNHLLKFEPDKPIDSPLFSQRLDDYLRQCNLFVK